MNYYSFHIADFALHTSHLTVEEEGVYRRLLDYYYDTETPIPKETKSVIRRLRLGSYEETVTEILNEFFVLQGDGWHNLRADDEIVKYHEKAERARNNGKRGGRPKKQKQEKQGVSDNGNPEKTKPVNSGNQSETQKKANQEPRTKNQEPEDKPPSLSDDNGNPKPKKTKITYPENFEKFWEFAGKKYKSIDNPIGNKSEAYDAFKKLDPDNTDCKTFCEQLEAQAKAKHTLQGMGNDPAKLKHLCRWLNKRCWDDEPDPIPENVGGNDPEDSGGEWRPPGHTERENHIEGECYEVTE